VMPPIFPAPAWPSEGGGTPTKTASSSAAAAPPRCLTALCALASIQVLPLVAKRVP
jgi:hypothetical protein